MTVIPFKKPDKNAAPPSLLYTVSIYDNGDVLISDPNSDEVDKRAMSERLLEATFDVLADADGGLMLVSITNTRTTSHRTKDVGDSPARRAWLRRRLKDTYEMVAGEAWSRNPLVTFFRSIASPNKDTFE